MLLLSHHRLIKDDLFFSFYWLGSLGGVNYRFSILVCLSVCLSVLSQNNHLQVLWRLLVEEPVLYIGLITQKGNLLFWRESVFFYVWYVRFCTSLLWIMRELAGEGPSLLALKGNFIGTSTALHWRLNGTATELQWHKKKLFLVWLVWIIFYGIL